MSNLQTLGVVAKLSFESTSTTIDGMEVTGGETTRVHLTLPRDAGVMASFSEEGVGKKLVNLFKKELQTGDQEFDDAIYISTDTPETTRRLLDDVDIRGLIALYVQSGGPLSIHGSTVELVLQGRQDTEDPNVYRIASAILAAAGPP